MSEVVVLLPPPMHKRALQMMLARAKQVQDEGQQVTLAYCAEKQGTCAANLSGNPLVCAACRYSSRKTAEGTGLASLPILADAPAKSPAERSPLTYTEASEIAGGVQSCLVTVLRVMTRDLNRVPALRKIKRRYFETSARLYRQLAEYCRTAQVQCVEVLNGRYACAKIGVLAAQKHGAEFNTLDFNAFGKPMVFKGHTPHDRIAVQSRIRSSDPDPEIARNYYSSRRSRSVNQYAAAHKSFEPPQLADPSTRRVSFFLSSQDECESLGPGWRSRFRNNVRVIDAACRKYPDFFFSVRFHPNQANIVGDVVAPFRSLNHENLQMYFPHDQVDTYQLIDWSDVVVTFASTVAIESCWQGKPVIELGPSYFDHLGISYTPGTLESFLDLLPQDLSAKPNTAAASFANYELNGFDTLQYLQYRSGRMQLVGAGRRAGLFAKGAKEYNNLVTRRLQKQSINALSPVGKCA